VKVAKDEIETGEVIREVWRQISIFGKESRELCRFDGADVVGVKSIFGQDCDVFVTEDVDLCVGISVAQCFDRWQGENKIANGPAPNDQSAPQNQYWVNAQARTVIP